MDAGVIAVKSMTTGVQELLNDEYLKSQGLVAVLLDLATWTYPRDSKVLKTISARFDGVSESVQDQSVE